MFQAEWWQGIDFKMQIGLRRTNYKKKTVHSKYFEMNGSLSNTNLETPLYFQISQQRDGLMQR